MWETTLCDGRSLVDECEGPDPVRQPLLSQRLEKKRGRRIPGESLVGECPQGDGLEYYRALVRAGWGLPRIAREHGIQRFSPAGSRLLPDAWCPIEGRLIESERGLLSEKYVVRWLHIYLVIGGEILI